MKATAATTYGNILWEDYFYQICKFDWEKCVITHMMDTQVVNQIIGMLPISQALSK